ncbi:hypothetical protein [Brevundimonas sp. A19_0]|uniref:hypothetical protein n=1 Tax=Brevundimonas sp. A19_0 TaxID=2821087 RepID=UPI001ADA2E7A|nr:hypothetical protein [Brevundimonas sp. A19_0]MBO9502721.1 hypothetical protein [Brevundimonas sp. A19_0]
MTASAAAAAPDCQRTGLNSGEPLVTSGEAAKAIFLAVEGDAFPQSDRVGYPAVGVTDEGEWWFVFRYRPPMVNPDGSTTSTRGGGQLSLKISKCDARISDVTLSR